MSEYTSLLSKVAELTNAFNKMNDDARATSELPDANQPDIDNDLIRLYQGGLSKKIPIRTLGVGGGGLGGDWVVIDDALVFKGLNVNDTAIEVGDKIQRYPATNRFIIARVDALPYTDDNNLSFFQDITLI